MAMPAEFLLGEFKDDYCVTDNLRHKFLVLITFSGLFLPSPSIIKSVGVKNLPS